MQQLFKQGYSKNAIAEAFECFPATVSDRIKNEEKEETNDRPKRNCRNF